MEISRVPAIIVHGGAGQFAAERQADAVAACTDAVVAARACLRAGGDAVATARAGIRVLEAAPVLNAGIGSVLSRDGIVEVDCAIMRGADLGYGAIAAVPGAYPASDWAWAVLDDGEHALLCGEAAWRFAKERGLMPVSQEILVTERARQRWGEEAARRAVGDRGPLDPGTVGVCVVDAQGRTAAITSTGGISYKRSGRIGDTPLPGCGTYADDEAGAASATGDGEAIMRVTTTRVLIDRLRSGVGAMDAAQSVIAELSRRTTGTGGVICVDRHGRLGAWHSTPTMAWAAARLDGEQVHAGIEVGTGALAGL